MIKIVMMNDSKTNYMITAIPYVGKVQTENNEAVPTFYVRKLTEPIHKTNRNVTTDNWFSSVPLFEMMSVKYGLTMVGTLRKNKAEVPPTFTAKGHEPGTSRFGFDSDKMLVSFCPKPNKVVLVLSTFHRTPAINSETGKPEVILYYNETKGGTDTFDQMCSTYSTCRKTRRWPQRFFFGMLDQAGVNAGILYSMVKWDQKFVRKDFLFDLGYSLVEPHLRYRASLTSLTRQLRSEIASILNETDSSQEQQGPTEDSEMMVLDKQVRCAFCPRSKDRKTKFLCSKCQRAMCQDHRSKKCCEC